MYRLLGPLFLSSNLLATSIIINSTPPGKRINEGVGGRRTIVDWLNLPVVNNLGLGQRSGSAYKIVREISGSSSSLCFSWPANYVLHVKLKMSSFFMLLQVKTRVDEK